MSDSGDDSEAEASPLERLAELVADGREVDWATASRGEPGAGRLPDDLVAALRAVEAVGRASRGDGTAREAHAAPLSRWGELEVVSTLGRGAFAEVYLACDPLLKRLVALKLYPRSGSDPRESEAILREGRLLARLRHPGVATVYGVDYRDGRFGMWMEHVDGETLASVVERGGRLAPGEAAAIGVELARALAEVHRLGILHRDVKAQNVMREQSGRLVLVDFGLGLEERRAALSVPSGTPLYLAPELLAGGQPSVATDLYALGVLLFFLVSGAYPCDGGTLDELRAAHATGRRRLGELRPETPAKLAQAIERAADSDPARRFQSADELATALAAAVLPRRRRLALAAAALLSAAALAGAVAAVRSARNGEAKAALFQGGTSRRLTTSSEWETEPALSPDGSHVAFVAYRDGNFDLWLLDIAGGAPPLRLSSGPDEERRPRWFPDGSRLVYEALGDGVPSVWAVAREGGPAELLLERAGDPAVSPDGHLLAVSLATTGSTRRIAVLDLKAPEGGPRLLTGDGDGFWGHRRPAWSPDGRTICYQDFGNLWLVELGDGRARPLTQGSGGYAVPVWSQDGRAVYAEARREGILAIWRLAVDGGSPARVTFGTGAESEPSLSADGRRLAYATVREGFDIVLASLHGGATHAIRSDALEFTPALASSGSFVVFASDREPGLPLWRQALAAGRPVGDAERLVSESHTLSNPAISPNEQWLAYQARTGERRHVAVSPLAGGSELRVSAPDEDAMHPSWSPAGDEIYYVSIRAAEYSVVVVSFAPGQASPPRLVLPTPPAAMHPRVSPDGSELAFVVVQGDSAEVWVAALDDPAATLRQLTSGAGAEDLAWLDPQRLAVSGRWGASRLRLRAVARDGRLDELAPGLDLGLNGTFSLTGSAGLIAYLHSEPSGDLWLIEAP